MVPRGIPILTALALLQSVVGPVSAQEAWNRFRGPNGQGVVEGEAAYPSALDPEKNLAWETRVAAGHSSPCVFGGRIFLTGHDGERFETSCIERATGKLVWKKTLPGEKLERLHHVNSPASSTPTTDGSRVYAYFGSFGLVCYDMDGAELWRRTMPLPRNTFGTAASPMLAGEHLVLNRDTNDESYLLAMNPATGETVWKTDRSGFQSSWSTPVLWERGGVTELLVYGAYRLTAYDLKDGTERWSVPGLADEPCTVPLLGDGLVYVTSYNMRTNPEVIGLPQFAELLEQYDTDKSGRLSRAEIEPNQSILSRLDADGEGDHPLRGFFRFLDADKDGELTDVEWQKMFRWLGGFEHANAMLAIRPDGEEGPEIVWTQSRGVPECPSSLLYRGRVYMIKNGGIASCMDALTGELKFQERTGSRGPRYSSLVAADGRIYAASARGEIIVFAAGDELEIVSRTDVGERIMATPALADGTVYLRTEHRLLAFE